MKANSITRSFYTVTLGRDNLKQVRVDFGSMPQENVPKNLTVQQLFDQALSAQQQKNSDEALRLYKEALDLGQNNQSVPQISVVYHNMSTIAFEKSDFLHAYTWSKKALALNPGNHMAQQAFSEYAKKFDPPTVARQISATQNLQKGLEKIPVDILFVLCLVLLFTTLHLFFKRILIQRKNQIEMKTESSSSWKIWSSFTALVFVLVLTGIRHDFDTQTRAIIMDKTGIQTAAGENKPIIYEAQSGLEVEVLQLSESYAQIRYPGAFSGWVPLKNLEILSLPNSSK